MGRRGSSKRYPVTVVWLRRHLPTVVRMLGGALALYLTLLAAVWHWQERLLFHPSVLAPHHEFTFGEDVHEVTIEVPGAHLSALHLKRSDPRGIAVFFHGNGGSLDGWFEQHRLWRDANWDLLMIDYRGYGKSSGTIQSEEQLVADARAAWAFIDDDAYEGKPRVIVGSSLGTGLATRVAAEIQPELTILVSPYRSMIALAEEHYPWVPSFLLRYPLATEEVISRIQGPLLLFHGEVDRLVPISHSEALRARARDAQLVRIPELGHNGVHGHSVFRKHVLHALSAIEARDHDIAGEQREVEGGR